MKRAILFLFLIPFIPSCTEKYLEEVLTVAGNYDANIVGVSGPHLISVSIDHGTKIFIDAPFDGEFWDIIEAKVKNELDEIKDIKIPDQEIYQDVYIEGSGIYFDYTIQLDYTLEVDGTKYNYSIVGSK